VLRELLQTCLDIVGGTSAVLLADPDLLPQLDAPCDLLTGRTLLGDRIELVCAGPVADQLRDWEDADAPVMSDDGTAIVVPLPGSGVALRGGDPRVLSDPRHVQALQVVGDLVAAVAQIARQLAEAHQRTVALEETRRRLREQNSLLRELAVVDELTGLHNRRFFERRLAYELDRFERYRHALGVVVFDVDHFKRINDTHGHPAGDEVLRRLSQVARETVRRVDILARWGGEEFTVLLPDTSASGAAAAAERLRVAVEKAEIVVDGVRIPVTISAGSAATFEGWGGDAEGLVRAADQALYRAKQEGRNRVVSAPLPPAADSDAPPEGVA
jgi:diguanylate cyclase (GGDEF)-like protein